MYAPAYAGATVAEAKAKAKASMEKYLASLVQREEEGWSVLAEELKPAYEKHFFSSARPLIPAKRKAKNLPGEHEATFGVAQVPRALSRPLGASLEMLHPPHKDATIQNILSARRPA